MTDFSLHLGIDLGIGSCGWALTDSDGPRHLGSRTFDVPETDKDRTPTNQLRRTARGMRRVIDRRRKRMNAVRALLAAHGLLDDAGKHALAAIRLDPWRLRAEGLDRRLSAAELAAALGHIAKHRGFRSNAKRDRGANAPSDSSAMLAAVAATKERLARWRSIGELFWKEADLAARRRNRDGDYSRTVLRSDLEAEIRLLLRRQRELGLPQASTELEQAFIETAFFQRPLADSENKVGPCPFEPSEKRAPRHAPSFERFRLLSRLAALRLATGTGERPLTPEEIAAAAADFGRLQGLSFKRLRKMLALPSTTRFAGIAIEDEGKRDVVARSGGAMPGSAALHDALGEPVWLSLLRNRPDLLDRIAAILAFRDDTDRIVQGLHELGLEPPILAALTKTLEDGAFAAFKGAGSLSAKACRAIIPHLGRGLVYSEACKAAGYDHAARAETDLDSINNPVARKALGEALKQINAVIRAHGRPTHIHVEMARDVGKSLEERRQIETGIEKRNRDKDRLRREFTDSFGQSPAGAEDLLRYELWKEQNGRCLYSDQEIPISAVIATDNRVQVDHILPWSRSGDDSFVNKTLCLTHANQDKKGRTPFEWFGGDAARWESYAAAVEGCKSMKGRKKRNLLLKDASVLEEKFRPRNLTDTRYACRLLLNILKVDLPGKSGERAC
jgi:CRISPR-associated endonuclease Csn1